MDTKTWIEQNPLRRWRKQHKLGFHKAAQRLSVGVSSLEHWEYGASVPVLESFIKLSKGMGIPLEDLREQWETWLRQRPGGHPTQPKPLPMLSQEDLAALLMDLLCALFPIGKGVATGRKLPPALVRRINTVLASRGLMLEQNEGTITLRNI